MDGLKRILGVIGFLFLAAGFSSASFIQIGVTVSSPDIVTENEIILNFSVSNTGDEAAHDVQVSLALPDGFTSEPVYMGVLEPNRPFSGGFRIVISDSVKPGTYPVVLTTHYTDANAYPFSTVSPTFIRYRRPTPIKLRGEVSEVKLYGEAEKDLTLKISNLDERPHKVGVRLHLPDELKATYYSTEVNVDARGVGTVTIPIRSFGALGGSSYLVFATMEYEQDGLHYASTASGMASILAEQEKTLPNWLPFAGLVLLVVAVVYTQLRK